MDTKRENFFFLLVMCDGMMFAFCEGLSSVICDPNMLSLAFDRLKLMSRINASLGPKNFLCHCDIVSTVLVVILKPRGFLIRIRSFH